MAWLAVAVFKRSEAFGLAFPAGGSEEEGGVGESDSDEEVDGDRGTFVSDVGTREENVAAMGEGDGRDEIGWRSGVAGVGDVREMGLSARGGV